MAGFGPINGAGTSDMLMRNSNSGAFYVFDIANNQLAAAAPMGQVGMEWSVAGIAVDPPTGSTPANVQLVQAMASYGAAGGSLNSSPIQPPALTAAASPLAAPFGSTLSSKPASLLGG